MRLAIPFGERADFGGSDLPRFTPKPRTPAGIETDHVGFIAIGEPSLDRQVRIVWQIQAPEQRLHDDVGRLFLGPLHKDHPPPAGPESPFAA